MRIAVTGTHSTGKTTLVENFVAANPQFQLVEEPYWELAETGHVFSVEPSIDEFEVQLEHSVASMLQTGRADDVIFDRCPLDLIAYLEVLGEAAGTEWAPTGRVLQRIEAALSSLNLLVFLPIVRPDGAGQSADCPELRYSVDRRLKSMIRQDSHGLLDTALPILELSGSRQHRLQMLADSCRC